MPERQRWWLDGTSARGTFATGAGYLAIALLFLTLARVTHEGKWFPLGVIWLVLSFIGFALGITRRRRERSRQDSDTR